LPAVCSDAPPPNAMPVNVGAFDAGAAANWFKGLIDDVRIYNRALSPMETAASCEPSAETAMESICA